MKAIAKFPSWRIGFTSLFSADPTAPRLEPSRPRLTGFDRRLSLALFLVAWIAVFDLFFQLTNVSVFYPAPLLLLARPGTARYIWRFAVFLVLLTYGIYVLKNIFHPIEDPLLNYRLVNRTFVAMTVVVLSWVLLMWVRWRQEQSDPSLSEIERLQEHEISATFAMLFCAPLVVLIAIVDFLSPANMNLAILYPIPLFICGWTRSKPLLWSMLVVLLILSLPGYFLGPPSSDPDPEVLNSLTRNRFLAAMAIVAVTAILHSLMGREEGLEA